MFGVWQVWAHVVSDLVLQPFALDDFEACLAQDELEIERIKKENPGAGLSHETDEFGMVSGYSSMKFLVPREDRPKLFVMNGALLAPSYHDTTNNSVVSFQMSPDYCGSPYCCLDEITYPPAPFICVYPFWRSSVTLTVGGGMVESFAFGGQAPGAKAQQGGQVSLPPPSQPFSLAEMAARLS